MNHNEKLIEETRQRLLDHPHGWLPSDVTTMRRLADALEAAEKAHTPTDDEREVLARITSETGDPQDTTLADEVLAAGFRRPVVPEPSAVRITIQHEGGDTVTGTPDDVLNHGHLKAGWRYVGSEPQGEPSDAPRRLVYEVNMLLSSVASHGPAALTDTSDRMYTTGLLRRLRDALDPKPAQQVAAGNAVRAEMARNGLDVHRMVHGQEIANVLAGAALDAALRAAGGVR